MNSGIFRYGAFAALFLVAASGLIGGARAATTADAHIVSSVRHSFVFMHFLRNDGIHVHSDNGVVTLTGDVSSEYHRTMADYTAADQKGVKSVDNKLAINPASPSPESDAWLAGKIRTVLLFQRSVSAVDTQVAVNGGAVTLRGTAGAQAQKDLTAEYVRDIDGVKSVDNQIAVTNAPRKTSRIEGKVDDASITAEVKLALFFHRSTSAVNTQVQTADGVVTLTGTAKTEAEKDLVGKIVSDIRGVQHVDNRITVG